MSRHGLSFIMLFILKHQLDHVNLTGAGKARTSVLLWEKSTKARPERKVSCSKITPHLPPEKSNQFITTDSLNVLVEELRFITLKNI